MAGPPPGTRIVDPAVPAVGLLLTDDAVELLSAFVAAAGGELRSHAVSQVRYIPGRSVTVQYDVAARTADGKSVKEMIVATSGGAIPDGAVRFESDDVEVGAWRFPDDPLLPGLASATNRRRAGELLRELGGPRDAVRLRTRAYRAGRRAVVEVSTKSHRLFLKVVRPERTARLQQIHEWFAGHVPVPHSLGWSANQGIVALEALPGRTLRKAVTGRSRQLPDANAILALLDAFPDADAETARIPGPRERVPEHVRLLRAVVPDVSGRLDDLEQRLAVTEPPAAEDTVHGDFHSSQLLTGSSGIVGLVDVDTAGRGERVDDLATMLSHLATLALDTSAHAAIEEYGASLIAVFDRLADPHELRLRTAAAVVGLATGPFRVQMPDWPGEVARRVGLAKRWVESADAAE